MDPSTEAFFVAFTLKHGISRAKYSGLHIASLIAEELKHNPKLAARMVPLAELGVTVTVVIEITDSYLNWLLTDGA